MKKFNHLYDIAFSLSTTEEDPNKVPMAHIIQAIRKRIIDLSEMSPYEAREAIGFSDTYEETLTVGDLIEELEALDRGLPIDKVELSTYAKEEKDRYTLKYPEDDAEQD